METIVENIGTESPCSGHIAGDRQLAGFAVRFLSLLVDIIVIRLSILLLLSPLSTLFRGLSTGNIVGDLESLGSWLLYIALSLTLPFFISFLYFVTFWLLGGETIGKKVFGLRVVGENGKALSLKNAILRYLGYLISSVFFIGFIWASFDEKKQGWHDRLATSYVVRD
ncbi:MAG: RDD family protein [Nitrospinota bacterium]|nr:RDD family protein [Nitrospinota bacterium]